MILGIVWTRHVSPHLEHEMVDWKEYIVMKRVYLYFSYLMQGLDY